MVVHWGVVLVAGHVMVARHLRPALSSWKTWNRLTDLLTVILWILSDCNQI